MDTVFTRVNRIVYACVAGFGVIVEDEDALAVCNVQDGHTVDRRAFCGVGGRVQDVVCTNNDCCICICKFGVDVIHFVEVFVVNVCFTEEHVHMTRHTTCHRVDCIFDCCAVCTELIGNLLYKVLCLCDCHTISGDDDDFFCITQGCGIVDFLFGCRCFFNNFGGGCRCCIFLGCGC